MYVRWNIAIRFGTEKLQWCGYYQRVKKFQDMFIHEREGHPAGHTDGQAPHDGIGRAGAMLRSILVQSPESNVIVIKQRQSEQVSIVYRPTGHTY